MPRDPQVKVQRAWPPLKEGSAPEEQGLSGSVPQGTKPRLPAGFRQDKAAQGQGK